MANNKREKKKMNPFVWVVFAIILPLFITSVIVLLALSFFNVDVFGWAKEKGSTVPVVSSFIKTDEEEELTKELEQAEKIIENQQEEIEELQQELESLESINSRQEQDIAKLEKSLEEEDLSDDPDGESPREKSVKQTAASFRKMDHEKAADIIQNLEQEAALSILQQLSNDVRGNILEQMESKKAAEFTEQLMVRN